MRTYGRNLITLMSLLLSFEYAETCIKLLDGWVPIPLEERTKKADIVLTANILYTSPIPGQRLFYAATFKVIDVLKGWELLQNLHQRKSRSIISLDPNIIASAKGFADSRSCFSGSGSWTIIRVVFGI